MSPLPKIKLVYFDIEGLGECIRLALTLAGIPFEDSRIQWSEWPTLKPTTPYGNLPIMYVNDDETPKPQSGAMLRWVGTLNPEKNLYPKEKLYEIEEALGLLGDLQRAWGPAMVVARFPPLFGYPEGYQDTEEGKEVTKKLRTTFVETVLPNFLKYFADMIEKNGGMFLCGDEPTVADCMAVPALRTFSRGFIDHVPADCLSEEPRIVEYIQRFCALDEIKGRYSDGVH